MCDRHENHAVNEEEKNLYPEVRNVIPDPLVEKEVDLLLSANVKPSKIRDLLKDCDSGPLDPRDLANRR
jgi:hypothetical protein